MLSRYRKLVQNLTRDDADRLKSDDYDTAIKLAVTRYSKDKPATKVEDVSAPGGQRLNLPPSWVGAFSDIQAIEYPIGNVPPSELDDWRIYQAPDGEEVLIPYSIEATESVRFTFTIFHTLDDVINTIPEADKEAVASYATSICCNQLAAFYSGDGDSTIQADSVDHQSKAREFSSRANKMDKRYHNLLGVDIKRTVAAGVVVDMDMTNSLGRDRLTHPNRYR